MSKRVLILSFSTLNSDPRVLRQIDFFDKFKFDIVLSGLAYEGSYEFYPLAKLKSLFSRALKLAVMFAKLYKPRIKDSLSHSSFELLAYQASKFDFILANDAETWPLAIELKEKHPIAKVIFDAHKQYAMAFSDVFFWNWFHKGYLNYVNAHYIPKADKFLTVCDGIAQDYEQEYGVKAHLILNTPAYEQVLSPSPIGDTMQLVHHGIANRSRKIEKMIFLMDFLDHRFELKLILMLTDQKYFEELKTLAAGRSSIVFLEPVATAKIPSFINTFDVGIFILEPVNFNYAHTLPNKFFEFIQARLAIAIGPSPEMEKIVRAERNGIVTSSFEEKEMASMLNALSKSDIKRMKENSNRAAWKYSNSENEKEMEQILCDLHFLDAHSNAKE